MEFSSARTVEQIVWQMRLADYQRSLDRARINELANGAPPYPADEADADGREVNVNDLTLTRVTHEGRMQLYQAFNKPGNFFTLRTDVGEPNKRQEWGSTLTNLVNRLLKRSDPYYQCWLSQIALEVLHGIGPACWENGDRWRPVPLEVGDVMIPAKTTIDFDNLPFFAIWRSYTPAQLRRLTSGKRNPGWNMRTVNAVLDWAAEATHKMHSSGAWEEYWKPEKWVERYKEDSGVLASDLVQTIDCVDFYYWDDSKGGEGWRRRIVLDAEGGVSAWQARAGKSMPSKNLTGSTDSDFLYSSGNRVEAKNLSEIVHFQFADLSAVAPFRYHSVRSLGFLLYAACHLQNRLRCAFSEAVFENLLMYMRVNSLDSAEKALKVELAGRGIIEEGVQFLSPQERWQPNPALAELGLAEFKQIIDANSSSYVQNQNFSRDRVEKTKFQVMAEVNAMTTLVSSALQMAYRYQTSQYREVFRRLCKPHSSDPEVREFRKQAIARGIPEKLLDASLWDVEPERILGGGNKTLEMAIAQQLMEWRAAYSPDAQQQILRKATLAITDDPTETMALVPPAPSVSNGQHDAMVSFGTLLAGGLVELRKDQNELEVAQTWLVELATVVDRELKNGGMVSRERLDGLQNAHFHIMRLIASVARDPGQQDNVRALSQAAAKLGNEINGFAQRLAEQQPQGDGEAQAEAAKNIVKLQGMQMQAQVKAENTRQSHAERTAQRMAQFELETQQKEVSHAQELQQKAQDHAIDVAGKQAQLAVDLERAAKTPTKKPE